jgi:single-strand DNA-binding protein
MSEGLNKVILLGNLGADPETKFGQSGAGATRLRLATTTSWFDKTANERKERTDWHSVVVFGKRGEALQKILRKGSTVMVEGRLQTSSYEKNGEKRYSTDVIADNVVLAGGRREDSAQPQAASPASPPAFGAAPRGFAAPKPMAQPSHDNFDQNGDDDIPFD